MPKKAEVDVAALARKIGMKQSELVDVAETPAGVRIVCTDGTTLIDVPDDTPDADGKTGLMFLTAPVHVIGDKSMPYAGGFPVFAQPQADDDEDSTDG